MPFLYNPSDVGGGGKVLQVVAATAGKVSTSSTIPLSDAIPQNTEGGEILTLAITPVSATSSLHFSFTSTGRNATSNTTTTIAIFVDSTASAIASAPSYTSTTAGAVYNLGMDYSDASASTTARTYKIRIGSDLGNFQNYSTAADDNGGVAILSSLTITEIEA